MIPKTYKEIIDLGDGRSISIETGKLAKIEDCNLDTERSQILFQKFSLEHAFNGLKLKSEFQP